MTRTTLLVEHSLLNTVLDVLDRDATEGGKPIRGEIAQLLRESIQVPILDVGMDQHGFDNLADEQERILKERLQETIAKFERDLKEGNV